MKQMESGATSTQVNLRPMHAMSVDVEEYFQVGAFEHCVKREDWVNHESRIVQSTDRILDLFASKGVKATFFTLGYVAKNHPDLIKRIVAGGHELASHGFYHQRVTDLSRGEFLNDISSTKALLEDIGGQEILGYRAPSFSICEKNQWAFEVLQETGHRYSSSTYPVIHDHYGTPNWPDEPYEPVPGLLELPQATIELKGRKLPVGGGGYFRLMPYALSKMAIKQFHKEHNVPYIFYFHPWEIDADQPKIGGAPLKSKFRHYVNLGRMEKKIAALSTDFSWVSIAEAFGLNK
jgi:polysaccharide deactylase family protein, PEP-CTERM locus subfamily|tara:strand:+ start:164 stop:1039 length:876 start_codon:yes stop_codon:yes gene_type:complete